MTEPRAPFDHTDPFDLATEALRTQILAAVMQIMETDKNFAALDDLKRVESVLIAIGISLCCVLLCEMQDTAENESVIHATVKAMLPMWFADARAIAASGEGMRLQ